MTSRSEWIKFSQVCIRSISNKCMSPFHTGNIHNILSHSSRVVAEYVDVLFYKKKRRMFKRKIKSTRHDPHEHIERFIIIKRISCCSQYFLNAHKSYYVFRFIKSRDEFSFLNFQTFRFNLLNDLYDCNVNML